MSLFSKKHPELYKKLNLFDTAIQNGQYKERYILEYKPQGYFDVLDSVSNQWLYGDSSITQAINLSKEMNFRKDIGTIETFYDYSFDEKSVEFAKDADPTLSQFILTAPIVSYVKKVIDKTTSMKKIYKFIFFGTGLGLHMQKIHEKINSFMYLIIEDNLELFRLSLFVTDYSEIGQDSELYFCVMSDNAELKANFDKFYHNSFIRNNYIKYALFYPDYRDKISRIQNYIVTQTSNTYLHDKLLLKSTKAIESVQKKFNFLDISTHYGKTNIFSKKPVILVAAGPSLNHEIEWLKKNAPFAIVIALFMTSHILEKHGIKPDIIVHIDENRSPVTNTLEKMSDMHFFDDSIFILAPSVEIDLFLSITQKKNIFLIEDRTRYRFTKGFLEGFSVGEITYALALLFGTKTLCLLGLDLALDPQTKKTHAQGHSSANSSSNIKDATSSDTVSLRDSEFHVKGNFLEKVPTLPLFEMSIHMVNSFTKRFRKEYQDVFNLNNGAFFTDTIPAKSSSIDFSSFGIDTHKRGDIYTFFQDNSSSKMESNEKKAFADRVEDAKNKRELILKFDSTRYPSMGQFQDAFVNLASTLIVSPQENAKELSEIYIIFLENVGGYIGDFFNTVNLPNPKRHIKRFQKIISKQFLKILDKYSKCLEEDFS